VKTNEELKQLQVGDQTNAQKENKKEKNNNRIVNRHEGTVTD